MPTSDEIIEQFRDELRHILMNGKETLKDQIARARAQFIETMSRLESEVEATSDPLADRMEKRLLETIAPLLSIPTQFAQQQTALTEQVSELNDELLRRDRENARLRDQNAQLSEQITRMADDLLKKDGLIARLTREREQLDQRVGGMVEEFSQARTGATEAVRSMMQRLMASLDRIESKKSQVDILTAFLEESSHFAGRVALFVSKEEMFSGWRSQGFSSESFSDLDIKSVHFSMRSDTILREAFESRRPVPGGRFSHAENGVVLDRLGVPVKDSMVAIPLVVKEKSTAVLYADGGLNTDGGYDSDALELLVSLVALSIELLAYRARSVMPHHPGVRTAPSDEQRGPDAAAEATAMPAPGSPDSGSFRSEAGTETSASEYLRGTEAGRGPRDSRRSSMPMDSGYAPAGREETARIPETPEEEAAGANENKLHSDAKRFARLLVSEIKLYNEQKVLAGRKNHDIYDRLKEDIDRSREMYMRRVSPIVSHKVDYFYDELVRTLGGNDPDALGSDCPGPVIGATAD